MIVRMKPGVTPAEVATTKHQLESICERVDESRGHNYVVLGLIGDESRIDVDHVLTLPGVDRVMPVEAPYRLVALDPRSGQHSTVYIGDVAFGGGHSPVIAGPCAVESYEQMLEAGQRVKAAGARVLRGEAYKPRTGPYSFQGLEESGLQIMARVSQELSMPFVAEVKNIDQITVASRYAHALRVGTRNMGNTDLLLALGEQPLPVILKRGMSATFEEWLLAAEYIAIGGNGNIILCERGIRTFETETRNTLDLSAVPVLHGLTHLPVIVDPSHAVGVPDAIPPMACAAIACGADGVMIDVHPRPEEARVDGAQALRPDAFDALMKQLIGVAGVLGRKM